MGESHPTAHTMKGVSHEVHHETQGANVCSQEYFTKTVDEPVVIESVERLKEHHPVEKEYVVETRFTGVEKELAEGRTAEVLGTTERIVSQAPTGNPCD